MKIRVVAALVAGALAGQAHAAGFQLAEYSATGLGRAFAGEAAMADNASAQGRNPALLMELEGQQLSLGAIYVDPNIDVDGNISASVGGHTVFATPANAKDMAPAAPVPNFYYSYRLSERWGFGVSLNSSYGLSTELPATHPAAIFGSNTEITTAELAPAVAYRINDSLAVGAAFRVVYGEGAVDATLPAWVGGLTKSLGVQAPLPPAGTSLKKVDGDGFDYGYRLGMTWAPSKHHRVGLAYHSEVELTLDGIASGVRYGAGKAGSLDLPLPAYAELASFHQLSERLALHASINWTDWSAFEALVVDFPGEPSDRLKEENFKDNWRVALGGSYQLNDQWLIRGGVALDKTAVDDEHRTLTIPDSDRLWFSFGAGYQISRDLTLDLALTYIQAHGHAPIDEAIEMPVVMGGKPMPVSINYRGEVDGEVWLAGAQLSYRF